MTSATASQPQTAILSQKLLIPLDAQYVDIAEDGLKIATIAFFVWAARFARMAAFPSITWDLLLPTALGLLVYYLAVRQFVAIVPKAGETTYYMALRKYR